MAWHLTDSIAVYAEHVTDLLELRADLNNLALTQIADARSSGSWSGGEPTFGWWNHAGHTLGAVSLTPPYEMLLNVVPDEALAELVKTLRHDGIAVPGVNGVPEVATRFAGLWTAGTSLVAVPASRMRLYRSDHPVAPEPTPAGRARPAGEDEFELLVDWFEKFHRELRNRPIDPRRLVRESIRGGLAWFWVNEEGIPASLAVRHPPAAGVSRIGPVYTLPEHRRQGFGAAVTAACTRHALETDSTMAVLFTDVANPTSNAIYQRIGYRPLQDHLVLGFRPRTAMDTPTTTANPIHAGRPTGL